MAEGLSGNRWRWVAVVVVVAACVVGAVVLATGGDDDSGGSAQAPTTKYVGGGTATIRLEIPWGNTLSPPKQNLDITWPLITAAYDRLVAIDAGGKPIPYLATSWKTTSNEVTFTLRKGVTCADGTKVTPAVVQRSLIYALDPKTLSKLRGNAGGGPFTLTSDEGANTVTVKTETPNNEMVQAFANATAGIMCPAAFEPGADLAKRSYGSGPFTVEKVVLGTSATVRRREGWTWGPQGRTFRTLPKVVNFKVIGDTQTAANLLVTGGLDVARVADPQAGPLRSKKALTRFQSFNSAPHHLMVNLSREPFKSNQKLRQALFTSIDRVKLLKAEVGPSAKVTNSIMGPGMNCYTDLANLIPEYDVDAAKKLFVEAGYTYRDGKLYKGDKPLTIDLAATPYHASADELLAIELRAVGVTVKYNYTNNEAYVPKFLFGQFDMTIASETSTTNAATQTGQYTSGPILAKGGYNFTFGSDKKLDALSVAAQGAPAGDCAKWEEYQRYYLGKYYSLPMGVEGGQFFTRGYDLVAFGDQFEIWSLGKRA